MSKRRKTQHMKRRQSQRDRARPKRVVPSLSMTTGVMAVASEHDDFDDFLETSLHRHANGERGRDWPDLEADAKLDGRTLSAFRVPANLASCDPAIERRLVVVTDVSGHRATTAVLFGSEFEYMRDQLSSFAVLGQRDVTEPTATWDHF